MFEEAFTRGLNEVLTVQEMRALLDRSIDKYEGVHQGLLQLARVRFHLHTQGPDRAQAEIDRLRPSLSAFENLLPLIGVTQGNVDTWRTNGGPYPPGFFRTT